MTVEWRDPEMKLPVSFDGHSGKELSWWKMKVFSTGFSVTTRYLANDIAQAIRCALNHIEGARRIEVLEEQNSQGVRDVVRD